MRHAGYHFLTMLSLILTSLPAWGYDVNVHEQMSIRAFALALTKRTFLDDLGISKEQSIGGNTAINWIALGSIKEDDFLPIPRSRYHFFDPTTRKGLLQTFQAAPDWTMDSANNPVYSIPGARSQFYLAFTSPDPQVREAAMARMFRGIGQVIHLVQDMAQPQHVRDDIHLPIGDGRSRYELYTGNPNNLGQLKYDGYPVIDRSNYRSFWASFGAGLAEFTNRSFVSEDTNFRSEGGNRYPLPKEADSYVTEETVSSIVDKYGTTYTNFFVRYVGNNFSDSYLGQSFTNKYLSTFSVFDFVRRRHTGTPAYTMNDRNHKAYADILVQRAVGYSAGLIKYFFRGEIELLRDINNTNNYIIKNLSTERMQGTFAVYYDLSSGERRQVPGAVWDNVTVGPKGEIGNLSFTTPTDFADPNRVEYFLVFNGDLGEETRSSQGGLGAVAVKKTIIPYLCMGTLGRDDPPQPGICTEPVQWKIGLFLRGLAGEPDYENEAGEHLVGQVASIRHAYDIVLAKRFSDIDLCSPVRFFSSNGHSTDWTYTIKFYGLPGLGRHVFGLEFEYRHNGNCVYSRVENYAFVITLVLNKPPLLGTADENFYYCPNGYFFNSSKLKPQTFLYTNDAPIPPEPAPEKDHCFRSL